MLRGTGVKVDKVGHKTLTRLLLRVLAGEEGAIFSHQRSKRESMLYFPGPARTRVSIAPR
jgi:hypothetical protein